MGERTYEQLGRRHQTSAYLRLRRTPSPLQSASPCPLGFALFLLVNAALFIRPAEIASLFEGWPIYEAVILLCLLCSLDAVIPQLRWSGLKKNPVTICVLGLWLSIILSSLVHGDTWTARRGAGEFGKVVIYYLLLVGLVDSPRRLRTFLLTINLLVCAMAAICIANYHQLIHVSALTVLQQSQYDANTDTIDFIPRLQALGIFSDPNDFSLVLVTAMFVTLHLIMPKRAVGPDMQAAHPVPGDRDDDCAAPASDSFLRLRTGPRSAHSGRPALGRRIVLTFMLGLLSYAFALTRSRGGFVALAAAAAAYALARWGWKRALPILLLAGPLMLFLFAGRQTEISFDQDDTGMGRVLIWREVLVRLHPAVVFGIGFNKLADEVGLVAHNSYVHCFGELGLVGGTMFVGMVFFLIDGIHRSSRGNKAENGETVKRGDASFRTAYYPLMMAIVCGYAAGMCSLSRSYTVSTYVVLGAGAAYAAVAARLGAATLPKWPVRSLLLTSAATYTFFELVVRILPRLTGES